MDASVPHVSPAIRGNNTRLIPEVWIASGKSTLTAAAPDYLYLSSLALPSSRRHCAFSHTAMGTLTAGCPRLDVHCPHKLATSCRLTSTPNCCACADERPHSRLYRVYVDGVGYVQRGTRWQSYCWFCKGQFAPLPVHRVPNCCCHVPMCPVHLGSRADPLLLFPAAAIEIIDTCNQSSGTTA